jgi:tight adherence protein C
MDIILYFLILVSVGLIIWGAIVSQEGGSLRMPKRGLTTVARQPFLDLSGVFPTRALLEKIGLLARLKKNIDAAHISISPEGFFNLKIIIMVFLVIVSIVADGKFNPVFVSLALILGYVIPDLILKRKIAKRKYLITRGLPETVDLLGLCIEAGLDFVNAVKWVIDKTPPSPMIEELAFVLEEIKWGKPRIQALKDMSRRLEIPEISSFVQTIIQAERMGTPVAEAFTILSEDSRAQRFHRGERIALQAPIKILVPLIFCILPVIGIVIGGPILLNFLTNKLF